MNVAFIVQTVFLINNVKSKIPSNENNTYRLATKFFISLGNYFIYPILYIIYFSLAFASHDFIHNIFIWEQFYKLSHLQQLLHGYLMGIN